MAVILSRDKNDSVRESSRTPLVSSSSKSKSWEA